ncbi:MAG: hypothetical protein CM15mP102_17030 [Flavobacteriales bacterium]|nr:MAG: hypothetical protein CM15mP102_17030 [Flavobacteriales bacterium]
MAKNCSKFEKHMTKRPPITKRLQKFQRRNLLPIKELNESLKLEKEKYVRLFAEFENYKRRTAKERIELFKTAGKDVLSSLVPVLEDFKRAISQEGSNSDDEGINLIFNKFNETLKNQGLIEVEVNLGDVFDAEIHEAISQIPAQEDSQRGKIIDIIQGGYKIGDNIITYPKVVVAQ